MKYNTEKLNLNINLEFGNFLIFNFIELKMKIKNEISVWNFIIS